MRLVKVTTTVEDGELADAWSDVQAVLDADKQLLDLSPAFRRVLFDLEDAFVETYVRAADARGRSRQLRHEAQALTAQGQQAVTNARQALARFTRTAHGR